MIEQLSEASGRAVSRETVRKIETYAALLIAANQQQNLVSASTIPDMWQRHIVDSAQLLRFAEDPSASWIDIGSGAGLPGIVLALLGGGPVTMVEPRRLRVEFLLDAVDRLGLKERTMIVHGKADKAEGSFDMITARAVASTDKLLAMTLHLSHRGTIWALPRGRSGKSELVEAQRNWQGMVSSHASLTDTEAVIITARDVSARGKR